MKPTPSTLQGGTFSPGMTNVPSLKCRMSCSEPCESLAQAMGWNLIRPTASRKARRSASEETVSALHVQSMKHSS